MGTKDITRNPVDSQSTGKTLPTGHGMELEELQVQIFLGFHFERPTTSHGVNSSRMNDNGVEHLVWMKLFILGVSMFPSIAFYKEKTKEKRRTSLPLIPLSSCQYTWADHA